jgi:hypothetical protein
VLVVLLALTILISVLPTTEGLASGLLQFLLFVISTAISIGVGFFSASTQGKEIVKPHGRKAVRRIVTLGNGIRSFAEVLQTERIRMGRQAGDSGTVDLREVETTFVVLESQIQGQLRTVVDAIEDWRDVVPEDVKAIEDQAEKNEDNE